MSHWKEGNYHRKLRLTDRLPQFGDFEWNSIFKSELKWTSLFLGKLRSWKVTFKNENRIRLKCSELILCCEYNLSHILFMMIYCKRWCIWYTGFVKNQRFDVNNLSSNNFKSTHFNVSYILFGAYLINNRFDMMHILGISTSKYRWTWFPSFGNSVAWSTTPSSNKSFSSVMSI